jgi:SAM-dependent methyltransferase
MSFYSDFAEHYERVFPFRPQVLEFLAARLDGPGRRILDLGCGSGHYAGRLAARGHDVVAIDLDPAMIDVARRTHPAVDFRVLDLRHAGELDGPFDLAFSIGNVAAHLPAAEWPALLSSLADLLRPGAAWILQVVNWDWILGRWSHRFPDRELPDGVVFQREYRDITASGLTFWTRLARGGTTVFTGQTTLHPLRAERCLALHADAGFELLSHDADFAGTPFDASVESGSVYAFRRRS